MATSCLLGQAFEVSSVKPSTVAFPSTVTADDGSFRAQGISLKALVAMSFGVLEDRVEGGPGWVNSERWSVEAATGVPGRLTGEKLQAPLQTLLRQRFQLRTKVELEDGNVFFLDVAKSGPKMKRTSDPNGVPKISAGNGMISSYNMTTARLADVLTRQMGRPVIDRTGLTDGYEAFITWTPEPGVGDPRLAALPPEAILEKRSIFSAVEEDLGLKLTSGKQRIPSVTILSAEKPDAN